MRIHDGLPPYSNLDRMMIHNILNVSIIVCHFIFTDTVALFSL